MSSVFILFGGCSRGQCSPRLARTQSLIVHGKIPSPACGGRGSHEKNARIFFMGTREGGRRPEGGNTKLAFIPLGSCSQTQYSSHLTTARKPGVYPAWRAPNPEPYTERIPSLACGGRGSHEKNARIFFMGTWEGGRRPEGGNTKPAFIPLGGYPQTQCLSRLTVSTSTMTLHRKENVETLPTTSQKTRSPWLSRLAAAHKPSIHPVWRLPATQCLSRLAAAHKSSICPAWRRLPINPAFIQLGAS